MKTTITLFFLLASLNLYSQPYWMWENPRPIGVDKYDCIILDASNYIVVGRYGTILRTSNSGSSWYQVEPVTQEDLVYITFINSSTGFVCGDKGTLLKSTNSGISWSPISLNLNSNLTYIHFINNNTGILGGINTILKTTDEGITWNNVLDSGITIGTVSNIKFPNTLTGYASGSSATLNTILKTTNGGNNWVAQLTGTTSSHSLSFFNPDTGFAAFSNGNGNVLKTTNGGINWLLYNVGTISDPYDIHYTNQTTGYIPCSSPFIIIKTTNAGINWFPFYSGTAVSNLSWLDENVVIGFGNDGSGSSVFRSTNAVANWSKIYSDSGKNYKINSIAYADTNHGVAVCDSGRILRTNNGVWTEIPIGLPLTAKLNEVKFINSSTGFIVGNDTTFLKTTDKGDTWTDASFAGLRAQMTTIDFMNETTGYIGGVTTIFKTTNTGNNWSAINVPGVLNAIYFKDSNTGLISSGDQIYRTTNGGINWEEGPGSIVGKKDIIFFNQNTGIVTGINRRTTNAGLNWSFVNSNFSSVAKVNSTSAVATDGHLFYKTTDLGLTWHAFSQQANFEVLNAIEYLSNGQLVVGGNKGNILRTVGPGVITGTQSISSEIPVSFSLSYNYPNPFNPVTKIRYDVPYRSNVKITIFDISGREIRTLINDFRDPGKYEIIFDAGGLSSGVYFYRIQTDDFSQTRKMILLK